MVRLRQRRRLDDRRQDVDGGVEGGVVFGALGGLALEHGHGRQAEQSRGAAVFASDASLWACSRRWRKAPILPRSDCVSVIAVPFERGRSGEPSRTSNDPAPLLLRAPTSSHSFLAPVPRYSSEVRSLRL